MPQSAFPNPQFTPRRTIARIGVFAAPRMRRISSASNIRSPFLARSRRSVLRLGRANPGPNRTGADINSASYPYLNTLRTRWMKFPVRSAAHLLVTAFRREAKSPGRRSSTRRFLPKCATRMSAASR